jgi:hypothetical protein
MSRDAAVLCDKIPITRHRDVYHWRMHVAHVRASANERLAGLRPRTSGSVRSTPPGERT